MTYSEFLSLMIENIQSSEKSQFYMCIKAKFVGFPSYGNTDMLSATEMLQAEKHAKRFLKHMNILLAIQHKMVCKERNLNPAETHKSTVLNKYFKNYSDKLNWLIALRDKHQKLESKSKRKLK